MTFAYILNDKGSASYLHPKLNNNNNSFLNTLVLHQMTHLAVKMFKRAHTHTHTYIQVYKNLDEWGRLLGTTTTPGASDCIHPIRTLPTTLRHDRKNRASYKYRIAPNDNNNNNNDKIRFFFFSQWAIIFPKMVWLGHHRGRVSIFGLGQLHRLHHLHPAILG